MSNVFIKKRNNLKQSFILFKNPIASISISSIDLLTQFA